MMTQGDIQFEVPGLSRDRADAPFFKSVPLNRHIIIMTAGDAGFQSDALQHLWQETARSRGNTTGAWSDYPVREVGVKYLEFCNSRRRLATDSMLAPYGLNADTFVQRQRELSDQFVRWVVEEAESIRRQIGDSTIICGTDETGAHIYFCDGTDLYPADSIGFAAIGSGAHHARSEFILGNHSRFDRFEHTILLAYTAKRRSQKAPGVGKQTDMFVIPPTGRYFLNHANLERLERLYRQMQRSQDAAFNRAKKSIVDYVSELAAELKAAQAAAPTALAPAEQTGHTVQGSSDTSSSSDQT